MKLHRAGALLAGLVFFSGQIFAADAKPSEYRGWKSLQLGNGLVDVQIVPDIGGRVIQFRLGDFEYLWVNKQLAGKLSPESGLGPKGSWLNYGGDKLWPAPQGWSGEDEWPGPPDAVLDGSPHAATVLAPSGSPVAVQLVSRQDQRSGIQFTRVIRLFDNAARVSFDSTMKNIDTRPRRWSIWQVTQVNAEGRGGKGFNPNIRSYSPVNPASVFPRGYTELFGLVNNPQFTLDRKNNLVVSHYQRRVGKFGVDNSAGWVATVDGTAGYVLVERFTHYPAQKYPDNTSATFWMSGPGQIVTDKVVDISDDPIETPFLIESEICSPLVTVKPGESYSFHLDWYAARIGGAYPILNCTDVGVTCEPFKATRAEGKVRLAGRFGVFYPAHVDAVLLDANGAKIGQVPLNLRATPAEPLVLACEQSVAAEAVTICVVLRDGSGTILGELGRTMIQK